MVERTFVICKSGRRFCVEAIGDVYTDWGDITFGEKKGMAKVTAKGTNTLQAEDSIISKENGYKNIAWLAPGTSPFGYIDALDSSGIERIESKWITYED